MLSDVYLFATKVSELSAYFIGPVAGAWLLALHRRISRGASVDQQIQIFG
jgi:hypothetical protein